MITLQGILIADIAVKQNVPGPINLHLLSFSKTTVFNLEQRSKAPQMDDSPSLPYKHSTVDGIIIFVIPVQANAPP